MVFRTLPWPRPWHRDITASFLLTQYLCYDNHFLQKFTTLLGLGIHHLKLIRDIRSLTSTPTTIKSGRGGGLTTCLSSNIDNTVMEKTPEVKPPLLPPRDSIVVGVEVRLLVSQISIRGTSLFQNWQYCYGWASTISYQWETPEVGAQPLPPGSLIHPSTFSKLL